MNWTEVQIKTVSEYEDIISTVLYDVGAAGLAIEDPNDIIELEQSEIDWDFVDSSLIDLGKDEVIVKAYFPKNEDLDRIIESIKSKIRRNPYIDDKSVQITITLLNDDDWAETWKEHYKPFKIGSHILIKPSWEDIDIEEGNIMIELDPGMAFGTGTHETTWMCIEAIEKYIKKGDTLYDIGCGSGILSIVGAKLGANKVVGVDLDPISVRTSKENVTINKMENIVEIREGNLLEVVVDKADIIVSNIIAEVISEMTRDLKVYLKDEGIFIASGIILDKIKLVEDSLNRNNFKILDVVRKNEWALIVAKNTKEIRYE